MDRIPQTFTDAIDNRSQLLTMAETCAILRISRWSLYELLNRRRLPSLKIGSRRLIRAEAVAALIEELSTQDDVR